MPVPIYSKPLRTIVPAAYTPFDDLQEIAREIVPFWQIRRTGDIYRSTLTCAQTGITLPGSPVYFLDGIMVDDINPLIFLNSEMLERIEIHNTVWFYGELELPGIVALFSRAKAYQGVITDQPLANTSYVVRDDRGIYASPSHEKKEINHDVPDLRQLLLWEPPYRLSAAAFTWGMVSSGSQYFHASSAMVTFVNMEVHPGYRGYGLSFYGQLLHQGVASLVVQRQIRQRGTQSRTSGGKIYHIPIVREAPVYYVLLPGHQHESLQKISHRNFLRLFADRQAEVRDLMRDKGIRVRSEDDLLRAVEALDSYLTHNQSW